jgi:hypothetical protein
MYDLRAVDTRQRIGQMEANAQAKSHVHAQLTIQKGFERFAGEVFQDQRQIAALIDRRERFGNARAMQRLKQQVFALQTSRLGCFG